MVEDLNSGLPDSGANGIIWINTAEEETLKGPEAGWAGDLVSGQMTEDRGCLGKHAGTK